MCLGAIVVLPASSVYAGHFIDTNYPPKNEIVISNFDGGAGKEWIQQGKIGTVENDTNPAHRKYGAYGIKMACADAQSVVIDKYNDTALAALKNNKYVRISYFTYDYDNVAWAMLYFAEDSSFKKNFSVDIRSTPLMGRFECCLNKKRFACTAGAAWERVRHARIVVMPKRHAAVTVTMSTLRMFTYSGKPKIILTMDDGLESQYTIAYPIMRRFNLRATLFIIGSLVGKPGILLLSTCMNCRTMVLTSHRIRGAIRFCRRMPHMRRLKMKLEKIIRFLQTTVLRPPGYSHIQPARPARLQTRLS